MPTSTKPSAIATESLLTSYEVGEMLQVNPGSINKWINSGLIQAFRTPGGHHRIKAGDLVSFLRRQKMPVPPALAQAGVRRLLVVDDDATELHLISRLLRPFSHLIEARLLDNGIDALVQFGFFDPHAVLVDVLMPGLDGVALCRRLKAMAETRDVRVLIASAAMNAEIERDAIAAGAHRCVHKPVRIEHLLEALDIEDAVGVAPTLASGP